MEDRRAVLVRHGVGPSLPSSLSGVGGAPLPRGISGGGRPPRPTAPTPAKTRRRPFVVPPPVHVPPPVPGEDSRDAALAPGGVLPPWPRHGSAFKTQPLSFSEPAHLPSQSRYPDPAFGHAAAWATQSTTSTPPLGYEAAGDDRSPTQMPLFDWSPTPTLSTADNAAKDPMARSSQSFMNLMTQDADADLEVLMEPDPTPTSGSKGASKRGGNYTHNEDIQLCISWMNVGNDPIVGNEQPSKTYWKRIADDFHANRTFESDRTPNSLEHRWGIIQKECMKFQGYYEEVERRHPSGVPYKEHIMEAQARYARADPKEKAFQFIHCWLKVRHSEKFASLEVNKRPAKSRELDLPVGSHQEDEGGHGQESSSSIPPPAKKARPPGRKQSKEKLKRSEGDDEYKDMMQNLLLMKTEEHKMKKERWNKDMMLEERRLQIEERWLLWEQEQKIMFCDLSTMDDHQRAYVLAKRAEIAKVASLNSSGGGGSYVGDDGSASVGDAAEFSSL